MQGVGGSITWILVMVAMMYFLILRPQQKQRKEREALLSSMKKGDRVITIGGIHGIIRAIKEDRVTLEIASEIYVHFNKSAIASIVRSDAKAVKAEEPEVDIASEPEDAEYVVEQDKPEE
ncbi:MAG TPA: preprotein translocase subunit YajC [Peptococcaceae bacterium]|nr:preprotein translocase subunit YajC [Peptococcaceae bacterium]